MRAMRISALAILLATLPYACTPSTGAQRTSFMVEATGSGAGEPATNAMGWSVEITGAVVSLGPLYFFQGDPLFARRTLIDRLLGIRVAYAHPGHYQEGDALAQLLEQNEVDLLAADPVVLGVAEGVTGDYNSARIGLHPGVDTSGVLGEHTLEVSGIAAKGTEEVVFVAHPPVDIDVEGSVFDHEVDGGPGKVHIDVDLVRWLQQADFTDLVGTGGEGAVEVPIECQVMNALIRGVDNTSAFIITWIDEE